jgi:hypothetical protein
MNEREAIIEKIRKLLRMQRGGTPGEVANALRLAQELAAKHGVDLGAVNPDEAAAKPIGHGDALAGSQIRWEAKYAGLVCQQFFRVEVFVRLKGWKAISLTKVFSLTFVGTEWDREIARHVFDFLLGHFRREWRTNRGRLRNRQAFLYGMYRGICHRLQQRQPVPDPADPQALIVSQGQLARQTYVREHFGETTGESIDPDGDAVAAKLAGLSAGLATEIRPGLYGSQDERRLIAA